MKQMEKFDVMVIGAGPGGYVAAIRAAQLGMKTAIVEKEHLGGICLNWGCIPTKALLQSAEMYHKVKEAAYFGVKVEGVTLDLKTMVDRSRTISQKLASGISHLLKKNKVTVFQGYGRLKGAGNVEITETEGPLRTVNASHIILATGARPRILKGLEPDGHLIWTSKEAMLPDHLPSSLLIIGSGAIGVEFGSFYQTLGTQVTIVEIQDRILPVEDAEISQIAHKKFEKMGMKIHTCTTVSSLKKHKDTVEVTLQGLDGTKTVMIERVIVAAGIQGNVEDLGLENTKVVVQKNQIQVDEFSRTAEKGVYAIGDVAGAPWLAHKASHEAVICIEKIAGLDVSPLKDHVVPGCTYSLPQVASFGLTEQMTKDQKRDVKIGRFPYQANGKALALGEAEGLIKTLFDAKTGELLGVHMIGADVTELIQGYAIAKTLETTEEELMRTIFPHPTLSEMMHESVLSAYGKAIHI